MIGRWAPARAVSLLPLAGRAPIAASVAMNLIIGILPVVFVVAGSRLLAAVPALAEAGWQSAARDRVLAGFAVAAGALLLRELLVPMQVALGELVARQIDGAVHDQLMAGALAAPDLAPLADPRVSDALRTALRELEEGVRSPGQAGAGVLALLARVIEWVGYCACVAVTLVWWAGLLLVAVVVLFRHVQRQGLRRYAQARTDLLPAERRIDYLRKLAIEPAAGKEIRIFGLAPWLVETLGTAYRQWLAPLWAARRDAYLWPFYRAAALGVVAVGTVLAMAGAVAAERLDLTGFFLVTQATLGAVRLGEFYPESDLQTAVGTRAATAVGEFRDRVAADLPPVAEPTTSTATVAQPRERIHFDGVTFRYPGSRTPVFENLDLTIPVGQCTAVVGVNAAGKSTLVKLLTRLYVPQRGAVRVDGVDIAGYPVRDWRRRIAVIFQDFVRYEVSAADNIGFGAVAALADREGIRSAAQKIGIVDDLDRLPRGLDTVLASHVSGGADLSGGQWQRVALARAVFALRHGASILVLDEPTAGLDARSEARFFDEFAAVTRGATTVLISHRFATVRRADHIIVLDHGRVVEQGSHDELVARDGRYARMFRIQAAQFDETQPIT